MTRQPYRYGGPPVYLKTSPGLPTPDLVVTDIRRLWQAGKSTRAIAARAGVSQSTASRYARQFEQESSTVGVTKTAVEVTKPAENFTDTVAENFTDTVAEAVTEEFMDTWFTGEPAAKTHRGGICIGCWQPACTGPADLYCPACSRRL